VKHFKRNEKHTHISVKYGCKRVVGTFGTDLGCNFTEGGEGTSGHKMRSETREKIALARKGKPRSPETIEKIRSAQLGKVQSPETKNKISLANTGKVRTLETREKMRIAITGKKRSPEFKEKNRLSHTGVPILSARGRKRSDAAKAKMRAARAARVSRKGAELSIGLRELLIAEDAEDRARERLADMSLGTDWQF
jgi:hypothetical protein